MALGHSLLAQPNLPLERSWDALGVLEANGVLASFPELLERWEELNESLDDEGSLVLLVEQLDDDPEGVWLALQGIGGVEPEARIEIIAGLAESSLGPGVIEFLRLLAYSPEASTQAAAVGALLDGNRTSPTLQAARLDLADNHPDSAVAAPLGRQRDVKRFREPRHRSSRGHGQRWFARS